LVAPRVEVPDRPRQPTTQPGRIGEAVRGPRVAREEHAFAVWINGGCHIPKISQLGRILGRWMRMITIPNQSSVAKALMEFDEAGRMKPSAFCERVVDVMEELMKFTLLTRGVAPYLADRYSERRESAAALSKRVNQRAWLFQVARNALLDRARTAHATEPLPEGPAEPAAPVQETMAPVDALADCLTRSLGELSPDDADILRACDLEGQTVRGFADAHGLGRPATKSRLLRARQRLRDRLTTACQVRFDADGSVAGHVPR
jgi:hypothetical protein